MFERHFFDAPGPYAFETAGVERRRDGKECAVVAQIVVDGVRREVQGIGNGPVEAFVAALSALGAGCVEVVDYAEHAAAAGAAARAIAYVAVSVGGHACYGAGRHEDVVLATFHAIVSAYNRVQASQLPLSDRNAGGVEGP